MDDRKKRDPAKFERDPFSAYVLAASAIMVVFLAIPLAALIARPVSAGGFNLGPGAMRMIPSAIAVSLATTSFSGLLILGFGTPLALVLARRQFPLKGMLTVLVELPIVMPPVVAGLALLLAFGRQGILGGPLSELGVQITFTPIAVVLAQVFVASPFYIRAAQIQFRSIPIELIEAAEIDGATGYRSMREVYLPLSWRALLAGFLLSWARALGEFGATILFAGNLQGSTQTMPLLVYAALEQNIDAAIVTGLILIGFAALSMGVVQYLVGRSEVTDDGDSDRRKSESL